MNRVQRERLEGRVRQAISALEALLAPHQRRSTVSLLADLIRRCEESSQIDGQPSGSGGERVGGGEDHGDPVLGTVAAREADVCPKCVEGVYTLQDGRKVPCRTCGGSGRRWADPVPPLVAQILEDLPLIFRATRSIDLSRKKLARTSSVNDGPGDRLQGQCEICGASVSGVGEDRLKRGCCPRPGCYPAWIEWRRPTVGTGDPVIEFQRFLAHTKGAVRVVSEVTA